MIKRDLKCKDGRICVKDDRRIKLKEKQTRLKWIVHNFIRPNIERLWGRVKR